jgi:hypothetical protein
MKLIIILYIIAFILGVIYPNPMSRSVFGILTVILMITFVHKFSAMKK